MKPQGAQAFQTTPTTGVNPADPRHEDRREPLPESMSEWLTATAVAGQPGTVGRESDDDHFLAGKNRSWCSSSARRVGMRLRSRRGRDQRRRRPLLPGLLLVVDGGAGGRPRADRVARSPGRRNPVPGRSHSAHRHQRAVLWAVGAVVPLLAVVLYLWNGVHGVWDDPAAGALVSAAEVVLLLLLVSLAVSHRR